MGGELEHHRPGAQQDVSRALCYLDGEFVAHLRRSGGWGDGARVEEAMRDAMRSTEKRYGDVVANANSRRILDDHAQLTLQLRTVALQSGIGPADAAEFLRDIEQRLGLA